MTNPEFQICIRRSSGGSTLAIKKLVQFEENFDIIAALKGLVA
jgi:hypothetical protein